MQVASDPHEECGRDCYANPKVIEGITDWEECSQEDYYKIEQWCSKQNQKAGRRWSSKRWVILILPEKTVPETLADVMKMVAADEEEEKKKKAAAAKRKKTLAKKKEEKEREQLAKLQEKYGDK